MFGQTKGGRPSPSAPTRAVREMTKMVLEHIGSKQPGVHIGVESPAKG